MLSLVNPTTLEHEVSDGNIPILIAFLKKDRAFSEQIRILETLADTFREQVKVCLGDEYFLNTFFQQFEFSGTPFYLLISNGKEQSRYFGHAALDDLEGLLRDCGVT